MTAAALGAQQRCGQDRHACLRLHAGRRNHQCSLEVAKEEGHGADERDGTQAPAPPQAVAHGYQLQQEVWGGAQVGQAAPAGGGVGSTVPKVHWAAPAVTAAAEPCPARPSAGWREGAEMLTHSATAAAATAQGCIPSREVLETPGTAVGPAIVATSMPASGGSVGTRVYRGPCPLHKCGQGFARAEPLEQLRTVTILQTSHLLDRELAAPPAGCEPNPPCLLPRSFTAVQP